MYLSQQHKTAEINRILQTLCKNNSPILGLEIPTEDILFFYIGWSICQILEQVYSWCSDYAVFTDLNVVLWKVTLRELAKQNFCSRQKSATFLCSAPFRATVSSGFFFPYYCITSTLLMKNLVLSTNLDFWYNSLETRETKEMSVIATYSTSSSWHNIFG